MHCINSGYALQIQTGATLHASVASTQQGLSMCQASLDLTHNGELHAWLPVWQLNCLMELFKCLSGHGTRAVLGGYLSETTQNSFCI